MSDEWGECRRRPIMMPYVRGKRSPPTDAEGPPVSSKPSERELDQLAAELLEVTPEEIA